MQNEQTDYCAEWRDLRFRFASFVAAWIGAFLLSYLGSYAPRTLLPILLVTWAITFVVTASRWSSFPCPQCRGPFFKANGWYPNQLRRTCPHCGLSIGD